MEESLNSDIKHSKKVRLSNNELASLEKLFKQHFLSEDELWLFGSRADLTRKGGDIDLYIETSAKTIEDAIKRKTDFIWELEQAIGEQKIDIVLNMVNFPYGLPIHQIAKTEGVRII